MRKIHIFFLAGIMCLSGVVGPKVQAASPDLSISGVQVMPVMGEPDMKEVGVYLNGGCFAGYRNYEVKFTNRTTGQEFFQRISACMQNPVSFMMCPGEYEGRFMVDSENIIRESNENNNEAQLNFTIEGDAGNCIQNPYKHVDPVETQTDLRIDNVFTDPTPGQTDKLRMNIFASTPPSANPKVKVSVPSLNLSYTATIPYFSTSMEVLAPGNPWPSGTYEVVSTIDPDNTIAETDESNNTFTRTLTVIGNEARFNNKVLDMSYRLPVNPVMAGNKVTLANLSLKAKLDVFQPPVSVDEPLTVQKIKLSMYKTEGINMFNIKLYDGNTLIGSTYNWPLGGNGYEYTVNLASPLTFRNGDNKTLKLTADVSGDGYFILLKPELTFAYPLPRVTEGSNSDKIYIQSRPSSTFGPQTSAPTSTQTPEVTGPASSNNDSEAQAIVSSGKDLGKFLTYRKRMRSNKDMEWAFNSYTLPLSGQNGATISEKYAINNFIVYGTPRTEKLSARQRFELVVKFKKANRALPKTEADWKKLLQ